MQRLHINGSISNKSCASDPPVRLAEPVLFILVTETNHQHKRVKHFTGDFATKRHYRELALAFFAADARGLLRLPSLRDSFWVPLTQRRRPLH